jgi:hypothetical protein
MYLRWVFLWEYFVERALSETARRRLLGFTLSEFAPGEPNTMLARTPSGNASAYLRHDVIKIVASGIY